MKRINQAVASAVLICLAAGISVRAAMLSDFESPIYTAGATFTNTDGWARFNGSGFTTPDPGNSGYTGPALDGAQSGAVFHYLQHPWGSLQNLVTNGLQVTWLMNTPFGYSNSGIYLSTDFVGGLTPLGLNFDSTGNIVAYTLGSGSVDTGYDYLPNKTYRLSMSFDFASHQMMASEQNVTDSGPLINLGTYNTGTINLTNLRTNGLFVHADTSYTLFDDIEVIPEPSAAVLLVLGGLVFIRRRTA